MLVGKRTPAVGNSYRNTKEDEGMAGATLRSHRGELQVACLLLLSIICYTCICFSFSLLFSILISALVLFWFFLFIVFFLSFFAVSLSLSHTHTHTQTRSVTLSLFHELFKEIMKYMYAWCYVQGRIDRFFIGTEFWWFSSVNLLFFTFAMWLDCPARTINITFLFLVVSYQILQHDALW